MVFLSQRRHDRLYLHGPHPRKTMVWNHGLHPLRTMVLKSPPWHQAIEKNIEVVGEGDFRTMVLRGCRPMVPDEGEDHAGTGDHAWSS